VKQVAFVGVFLENPDNFVKHAVLDEVENRNFILRRHNCLYKLDNFHICEPRLEPSKIYHFLENLLSYKVGSHVMGIRQNVNHNFAKQLYYQAPRLLK